MAVWALQNGGVFRSSLILSYLIQTQSNLYSMALSVNNEKTCMKKSKNYYLYCQKTDGRGGAGGVLGEGGSQMNLFHKPHIYVK